MSSRPTRVDRDILCLRCMLHAAEEATAFMRGRSKTDLKRNEQLTFALTWLVGVIGRTARGLSYQYRRRTPGIPWKYLADTADRLRRQYLDVDHDLLWQMVTQQVSPLIPQLKHLLVECSR